jgi:hypothetical protein
MGRDLVLLSGFLLPESPRVITAQAHAFSVAFILEVQRRQANLIIVDPASIQFGDPAFGPAYEALLFLCVSSSKGSIRLNKVPRIINGGRDSKGILNRVGF